MTLQELYDFMQQHWDKERFNDFVVGKPGVGAFEDYIMLPATPRCVVCVYPRKEKVILAVMSNSEGQMTLAGSILLGGYGRMGMVGEMNGVAAQAGGLYAAYLESLFAGEGLLSGSYDRKTLETLGSGADDRALLDRIGAIQRSIFDMNRSADRRMTAELCLMTLCDERLGEKPVFAPPAAPASRPAPAKPPVPIDRPPWDDAPAQPAPPPPRAAEPVPPAAAPAPAPAPGPSASADWPALLADLKAHLDMMPYIFLSQTEAEIGESSLIVYTKDLAAQNILDVAAVRDKIQSRATALLGRPVSVSVQQRQAQPSAPAAEDKLDRLAKFENIVKFK